MSQEHRNPPPLPATPLSYQSPGLAAGPVVRQSSWPVIRRFFAGLILGSVISAIIWIAGWKWIDKGNGMVLIIVPGVKLVAGIVFLCIRGKRSFGAGILVSIALGFLILMGACMANINWSNMH